MSRSPAGLPAFSFDWTGGDLRGLSRLAGVLYDFAGRSEGTASSLNHTVDRLISESGDSTWRGSAADGFKRDFGADMADVRWLSSSAEAVGGTVDDLAQRLAKIESWLENQAEQGVRARYITIDTAGKIGLPRGTADPQVQKFLQQFNQCRTQAMAAAKTARKAAAAKLAKQFKELSAGLANYQTKHGNLLSKSEMTSLTENLANLRSDEAKAEKLLHPSGSAPHWSAGLKGAVEGAGTLGGFAGLFATETGPLDPPIATAAAVVGGVGGLFKGLVTGNGDILDW